VELGSGGGFIKEIIPGVKTSDILELPDIDMRFSALDMPFRKSSINVFLMIDVFHHIENADKFFKEVSRCLKTGGQIVMIEPSSNFFGRLIWGNLHHEPHDRKGGWEFESSGPLSGANSALPWIIFFRDRKKFAKKYPHLRITGIDAHTSLKYLLSGGFSFRQMIPNFLYDVIGIFEFMIMPINKHFGMFYTINIVKK
jgi:SAM-dependent methyltransferase